MALLLTTGDGVPLWRMAKTCRTSLSRGARAKPGAKYLWRAGGARDEKARNAVAAYAAAVARAAAEGARVSLAAAQSCISSSLRLS